MSALTEQVAREHVDWGWDMGGYYCIGCDADLPGANIAKHVAEVTEQAVRANVAAEIRALMRPASSRQASKTALILKHAARIAEGKPL